nr:MAG TPA: hypothetical protein [Caudoviricetes sp.]
MEKHDAASDQSAIGGFGTAGKAGSSGCACRSGTFGKT